MLNNLGLDLSYYLDSTEGPQSHNEHLLYIKDLGSVGLFKIKQMSLNTGVSCRFCGFIVMWKAKSTLTTNTINNT